MYNVPSIAPAEFSSLYDSLQLKILDVREEEEILISAITGSLNIPMMEVENNLDRICMECEATDLPLVVICKSGSRSAMVTAFLLEKGLVNVYNLSDGINGLAKVRADIVGY